MAEVTGIKRHASFGPEGALVARRGVAKDADGFGERFCFNQQFIAVRRTTDDAKRLVTSTGNLPGFLAGEIEDKDTMLHTVRVGDKDGVSNHEPIADGSVVFRDDIDPLVFRVLP